MTQRRTNTRFDLTHCCKKKKSCVSRCSRAHTFRRAAREHRLVTIPQTWFGKKFSLHINFPSGCERKTEEEEEKTQRRKQKAFFPSVYSPRLFVDEFIVHSLFCDLCAVCLDVNSESRCVFHAERSVTSHTLRKLTLNPKLSN